MEDRLKMLLDFARDQEMELRGQADRIVSTYQVPITWFLSSVSFAIAVLVTATDPYSALQRVSVGFVAYLAVGGLLSLAFFRRGGKITDLNRGIANRIANLRRRTIDTQDEAEFRELFNIVLRDYSSRHNRLWRGWVKESGVGPRNPQETESFIRGEHQGSTEKR